jgi:hypothetical protein
MRCQWWLPIVRKRIKAILGHKMRSHTTRWADRLYARIVRQAGR